MSDPGPLAEITTKELIDELARRSDGLVVCSLNDPAAAEFARANPGICVDTIFVVKAKPGRTTALLARAHACISMVVSDILIKNSGG